jgi:hypothetical protein
MPRSDKITDDHYGCFLSVMRLFTSFFETDSLFDEADRNFLLELSADMFRFPPFVRAIYDLVHQRMIVPEDRSVLAHCLLGYYDKHHDPKKLFEAQFPELVLGFFYGQISTKKARDSGAPLAFLKAFSTEILTCAVTNKKLSDASVVVDGDRAAVTDTAIAKLYTEGFLRGTNPQSTIPIEQANLIVRLTLFSAGRFAKVTCCKSYHLLEKAAPVIRVPKGRQELSLFDKEAFAIHAPKDVPNLLPPALTRDESGRVCMFVETSKAVPPKKYLPNYIKS